MELQEEYLKAFISKFTSSPKVCVKHLPPFRSDESGKTKASKIFTEQTTGKMEEWRRRFYEHLTGECGLAVYPVTRTQDIPNACFFTVIDIDFYTKDFSSLVVKMKSCGLKFVAFRSKSKGLHIYFFYDKPVNAAKAVQAMQAVVSSFALDSIFGVGKVEIFPKQTDRDTGNCIFLPYFGFFGGNFLGQCVFDGIGGEYSFKDAINEINANKTNLEEISQALSGLPYADAPKCIQSILMSGSLGANSGRNAFLFHCAIYLQKKFGKGSVDSDISLELLKMNAMLPSPLEEEEVRTIAKSVAEHAYDTYPCKKEPAKSFCDRKCCSEREYGIGSEKNNRFTGFFCWGELTKYKALEPYYIWKVKVEEGDDAWRELRIDSVQDLQSQTKIQALCFRDLDMAPHIVKPNDWIDIVNQAMHGIKDRTISVMAENDTSDLRQMRTVLAQFLLDGSYTNKEYLLAGGVWDDGTNYCFVTKTVLEYYSAVSNQSSRLKNIRAELLSMGCKENTIDINGRTVAYWSLDKNSEIIKIEKDRIEVADRIEWAKMKMSDDDDEEDDDDYDD